MTGEAPTAAEQQPTDGIRRDLGLCFFVAGSFTALLAYFIWTVRISQFSKILTAYGANPESAKARIFDLDKAGGTVPAFLTLASIIIMFMYWRGFHDYLLAQNDENFKRKLGEQRFNVLEEMNDPPGDVFTLIGIAFTFAGLAFSMACIPADLIANIMAPNESLNPAELPKVDETALRLIASAIVFGSSLAVGLLASLNGVILSLCARHIAAKYGTSLSNSSTYSKHIGSLPHIHTGLAALNTRMEDFIKDFSKIARNMAGAQAGARRQGGAGGRPR